MQLFYRGRTAEVFAVGDGQVLKLHRDPDARASVRKSSKSPRVPMVRTVTRIG